MSDTSNLTNHAVRTYTPQGAAMLKALRAAKKNEPERAEMIQESIDQLERREANLREDREAQSQP